MNFRLWVDAVLCSSFFVLEPDPGSCKKVLHTYCQLNPNFRYYNLAFAYSDISDPISSLTVLIYHLSVPSSTVSLGVLSDFLRCTFRPLY